MDNEQKTKPNVSPEEKEILLRLERTQGISLVLGGVSLALLLVVCGFIFYLMQDRVEIQSQLQKRDKQEAPLSVPLSNPTSESIDNLP